MDKNEYFEQLYVQYHAKIYSYIDSRIHCRAVAEELANDVFVSVYRNLHTYDPNKSFIAVWLYAIAGNRLKNYYKSNRNHEQSYVFWEEGGMTAAEGSRDEIAEKELRLMLESVMKRLPERNRKIVWLKYFRNMTSQEIGEYMGLTSGNVRIILKRSLNAMKEILEQRE